MSKNLQIHIPEPCGEGWDNMGQAGNGRFCSSCCKTVVDFSLMSDQEVLSYLGSQEKHVCGRFTPDQLDRDIRLGQPPAKRSWSVIWRLAVVGMLLSVKSHAQTRSPRTSISKSVKKKERSIAPKDDNMILGMIIALPDPDTLDVKVVDSVTHLPVGYATIRNLVTRQEFAADSTGEFCLQGIVTGESSKIEVSSVGYATEKIELSRAMMRQKSLTITLAPAAETLKPLTVISYGTTRMGKFALVGDTVLAEGKDSTKVDPDSTVLASITDRIQDSLSRIRDSLSFLGIKPAALSVYPNPVPRGSVINLSFRRGQAGPCNLGLFNAAGALVLERNLDLTGKAQQELLSIPSSLPAGTYFIKTSSPGPGKAFTQKLVVQ